MAASCILLPSKQPFLPTMKSKSFLATTPMRLNDVSQQFCAGQLGIGTGGQLPLYISSQFVDAAPGI